MPATNVLLVATNKGLYRSTDGGGSYNLVTLGGQTTGYVTDLDMQDGNSNNIWVAVKGQGIFYSNNQGQSFGGNLWAAGRGTVPSVAYKFVSMGASSDGQTIYANAELSAGSVGVWKTTDGGSIWVDISANATANVPGIPSWRQVSNCQCGYDQTMGVDPQDANRIYMGFQDMWLSEDGGTTWRNVTYTNTNYTTEQMHVDHHALTFSPSSHRTNGQSTGIWVGNDGGVWTSTNGGTVWTNKNSGSSVATSLATHLFRDIDTGRGSGNNEWTYGGTQDNGTSVGNPSSPPTGWTAQWSEWSGGDGSYIAVDWKNPQIAYGNWGYTHNGGVGLNSANNYAPPNASCSQESAGGFSIAEVGPQNSMVFLAGTCGSTPTLFLSSNQGVSYTDAYSFTSTITSIGMSASDASVFYVACADGKINQMKLTGTTVTLVQSSTISGTPSPRPVVTVNPVNPQMVVAVFSGYSQHSLPSSSRHVYLSLDGVKTWSDISGTTPQAYVPDVPLYSAVIDPNTAPYSILTSSDFGVFRTFDYGLTWHVVGSKLPHTHTIKLALDPLVKPSLIKAGTFGRSIWKRTLDPGTSVFPQLSPKWMAVGNITLQNKSSETLSYYQIFNNGTENKFAEMAPGSSNIAGFFGYTGVIAVRDSEGNIVLPYVVNGNSNQVVSISDADVATAKSNGFKNYPGLRSFPGGRIVNNFNVYNQSSVAIKLYWLKYDGLPQQIAAFKPGQSNTVESVYYGGTFIATDSNDNLIGVYVATDASGQNFYVTNNMVNYWK